MGFVGLDFGVTVLIAVVVNSVVIEFVSMVFCCFFAGACCLFMVACPVAACWLFCWWFDCCYAGCSSVEVFSVWVCLWVADCCCCFVVVC